MQRTSTVVFIAAALIVALAIPLMAAPASVAQLRSKLAEVQALVAQIEAAVRAGDRARAQDLLARYTAAMRALTADLQQVNTSNAEDGLGTALAQIADALERLESKLSAACEESGAAGCDTAMSVAYHGLQVAQDVVSKAEAGNPGGPDSPAPGNYPGRP